MKEYIYLVSQLPDIQGVSDKGALPITEEYYRDLCNRFLSPKEQETLAGLSLEAPREVKPTGSSFLDRWYDRERCLRYALAIVRASNMKREFSTGGFSIGADVLQAARSAVGQDSPLSAEEGLYTYRMAYLDSIQPMNAFSIDAVYAYGIRLLLLLRSRKFDSERGMSAYHRIYDTILGDEK